MKKMNKKGFTIVELSIVIAVIAILAGVLVPTFSGMIQKSKDAAAMEEAKAVYTQYLYNSPDDANDDAKSFIFEYDEARYVAMKGSNFTLCESLDEAKTALGCIEDNAETADINEKNYEEAATNLDGLTAYIVTNP